MNRIDKKFKDLKKKNKKAFIAFITAGYPNLDTTRKLVLEFAKNGVDIVELGVPFSDPMADGPIIQEASQESLKRGVNLNDILKLVKTLRKDTDIPLCLMTYYNPIFCFGEEKFARKASGSGVDGVIIPDLPPEEAATFIESAKKYDLDIIFFLAPTSTKERMKFISGVSRGFIYYVSLTGVTGVRKKLPSDLINNLKAVKKNTRKPVCVGFGVSSAKQVRQIYKIADGVIIGSAIIRRIKENIGRPDLVKRVGGFIRKLKI
ncbi:MAG: tryptophan synthase subunit alpha [Candidatus Omnitrophica bacterium]|nr:tryptophan synthase subunit alpha [Candidatus Omnitrophota bacterium]MDD5592351.1 tryptophan synthase subunit alpha [Candidatus Omnitrophota bacterium]